MLPKKFISIKSQSVNYGQFLTVNDIYCFYTKWTIKLHVTRLYTKPFSLLIENVKYKKAQLSLTNPRDACEKFARFT